LPLPAQSLAGATIAFDLDGTLVDTAPDLVGAVNELLAERGLSTLPFELGRVMIGRGARALIEQGFAAAGLPLSGDEATGLTAQFIDIYRGMISNESRVFDGVEATLDELARAGALLSVCTNKRTDLSVALLDAFGLTSRFAAVIGSDKAPAPKPDGRHVITAIEAAGGAIGRSIMVGDSASDVGSARNAGVPSVVVSFGYTEIAASALGGDYLIDHFAELPALAARILT
jgi:phosphoglycolate phosphatase